MMLAATQAGAQCTTVITGLREPLGTALSNQGNLLVSESGTTSTLHSGRISIVDDSGNLRTLLDGLPSARNDVGDPSGPAGIFMLGRTLFVAIGVGDVGRNGGAPGITIPNPNPISSPIFSSILAIHFSANTENTTTGFSLTVADQQALADGETVRLIDGVGNKLMIRMVADFPNYIPLPLPGFPQNISVSNPFQLLIIEDHLYVTDGGRNLVWDVNLLTGSFSALVSFPRITNPTAVGAPQIDAVPTGIAVSGDQLLVALFSGFPFPPGASSVEQVDPVTGNHSAFITGLRTAIGVLATGEGYLVLQHNSGAVLLPPWSGPGVLLNFETPAGSPTTVASCLVRPTSMILDQKAGTLYISEYGGRIVAIQIAS